MILLNLGCGGLRPSDEWWLNIDNLYALFPTRDFPERQNLDAEHNYKNADLRQGIPFDDNSVDGVLASHMLEHLDCQESVKFLKECKRVLKPGGALRISVPDPEKFHKLTLQGCQDWGEPNPCQDRSFMEYALFFHEHKQLLTKDSLFCLLWVSGFRTYAEIPCHQSVIPKLALLDNRPVFSLFVEAIKE